MIREGEKNQKNPIIVKVEIEDNYSETHKRVGHSRIIHLYIRYGDCAQ